MDPQGTVQIPRRGWSFFRGGAEKCRTVRAGARETPAMAAADGWMDEFNPETSCCKPNANVGRGETEWKK